MTMNNDDDDRRVIAKSVLKIHRAHLVRTGRWHLERKTLNRISTQQDPGGKHNHPLNTRLNNV